MKTWLLTIIASLLSTAAFADGLQFETTGGQQLTVRAKAEQQKWLIIKDSILVAAVADGNLVVEQFAWSPGPQPTPPNPEPGPQPEPEPQPVPGPKTVLWIEESADRTPGRAGAVVDAGIRSAIQKAGWSLRVIDIDVVDENGQPPSDLAPYLMAAKQAGLPRVFIFQDGREVYAGAAPPDVSSFANLLRRYGLPVGTPGGEPRGPTGSSPDVARPKQEAAANGCPTGRCPVPTIPTRKWRLFR